VLLAFLVLGMRVASAAPAAAPDRLRDNLYGVEFVDEKLGWTVGAFGTIFRTVDGGASWHPQVSHTTEMLYDVDFVDAEKGWIVGRSGLILRTENGGETWTAQPSGVDKHLFGVDFVDAEFGVAIGDWGSILVTSDGGRSWQSRALEEDVILNDVAMRDRARGVIVGEIGTILTTADGGASWQRAESGIDKTLFGVSFSDAQSGWAVGIDAIILHTDDGGATWEVRHGSVDVRELEQVGFAQAFDSPSLYAIAVAGDVGFAAGEIGAVFVTADGGHTWQRRPSKEEDEGVWYRALSLVPGTHGAIVGAKGARLLIGAGKIESEAEDSRAAQTLH
jgi:photosystem II stability/assembly factor-like uncharacterized protein